MGSKLYLRVNGIQIDNLKLRRKMLGGLPRGDFELVIEGPLLGKFSIDDNEGILPGSSKFVIEVTHDRRKKWEIVSVQNFLAMLDSIEATS